MWHLVQQPIRSLFELRHSQSMPFCRNVAFFYCLHFSVSVCLTVCVCLCLSVCSCLHPCLSLSLPISVYVCLCLFLCPCLSFCVYLFVSACLCLCLGHCLCPCLCLCLSLSASLSLSWPRSLQLLRLRSIRAPIPTNWQTPDPYFSHRIRHIHATPCRPTICFHVSTGGQEDDNRIGFDTIQVSCLFGQWDDCGGNFSDESKRSGTQKSK